MVRRKRNGVGQSEPAELTLSDIEKGITKLSKRIREVHDLENCRAAYSDAQVTNVERNIRDTVRDIFGEQSPEFEDNQYLQIWHGGHNYLDSEEILQKKFMDGIPHTVVLLEGLIARLKEKREDLENEPVPVQSEKSPLSSGRKVFVVHGHDEGAKQSVARFLEKLELEPIILHEQPNKGATVIEKLEKHGFPAFVVVLLTPDVSCHKAGVASESRSRARQNVIFELGYFIGKLGRERVCTLYKNGVEIPSDWHGIIYVPLDESDGWQLKLAKEIKAAGIAVDLNEAI